MVIGEETLIVLIVVAIAAALALASLGGGLYEFTVVDPFWPRRPDLIQPERGGISRRRFWIPAHIALWDAPAVRSPLLVSLTSHVVMRLWSAVDFIPKALAFERADPAAVQY